MTPDVWISFVGASFVLCMIPGPTIMMVVAQALHHGKKSVVPLVIGTEAGNVIAMTLSFIGLEAVLATSATLFYMMKWMGAFYLIYLGVKYWRSPVPVDSGLSEPMLKGHIFRDVFIVTALNPKSVVFFVVLFPLFVNDTTPLGPQLLIMGSSFMGVSVITVLFYGLFSGHLHAKLHSRRCRELFNKIGGCLLVSAGIITGVTPKS